MSGHETKARRKFTQCILVPGCGLMAHEIRGGHTLERHVGKSQEALVERFIQEKDLQFLSTFNSRTEAEFFISEVVKHLQKDIKIFLSTAQKRHTEGFIVLFDGSTGKTLFKGSNELIDVNKVKIVLEKDPNLQLGYIIKTAFPTHLDK